MDSYINVRRAVHVAVLYGMAAGIGFAGPTLADNLEQAPPAGTTSTAAQAVSSGGPGTVQLHTVEVTGTKIRRTDVEQSQPIQIITAAQIKSSGLATVGQVLQQITSSGSALNAISNNSSNETYLASGASNVELRYLGLQRTLVLVNGHRWATAIDGTVNLETIPSSIIDHVEILQDGASAIYGSEAIAGVVNIITVKNFHGADANVYLGIYNGDGHYDGLTTNDSVTIGTGSEHSNIVISASYMNQNGILASHRAMSKEPTYGTGVTRGSASIPQGRFQFIAPYSGSPTNPDNVVAPSTGLTMADCPTQNFGTPASPNYLPHCNVMVTPGTPGTSASDFQPFTASDDYNYAPSNYLLTPQSNSSVYLEAHHDFIDNLSFSVTASASRRRSAQQAGPGIISLGANDHISFQPGDPFYPFNFPLNTAAHLGPNLFQSYGRRLIETGPRRIGITENMTYVNPELDGFFDIGDSEWDWDIGYAGSKDTTVAETNGLTDASFLQIQLNPAQCATYASGGCTPLNLFGGQTAPMTSAQTRFFSYTGLRMV